MNHMRIRHQAAVSALLLGILPLRGHAQTPPTKATPAVSSRAIPATANPLRDRETVLSPKEGEVFIRHYLRPGGHDKITAWVPTAQDLRQLQAAYAKIAPLEGQPDPMRSVIRTDITPYYRQYVPVVENGRRLILISGLSPSLMAGDMQNAAGRDAWRMSAVFVFDGGRDVFHALYDPAQGKIVSFDFNGL